MHPAKVRRDHLHQLTDLPNIGPASAADLRAWASTIPKTSSAKTPIPSTTPSAPSTASAMTPASTTSCNPSWTTCTVAKP